MTAHAAHESHQERTGDNLYPVQLEVAFGEMQLSLDVPEGVWNPTPHGVQLGRTLAGMDFSGEHVLELGTGCGLHAIALARRGAESLMLTEIEQPILDNAAHNLARHKVTCPVELQVADWTHVEGGPWDALVTNPPFAKSGKRYRRHFIDTLILDAHKLVRPGGRLVFIQSSMANLPRTLGLMEECGMTVRILAESDGPFRPYYLADEAFMREMAAIPGSHTLINGEYREKLTVLEGRLS